MFISVSISILLIIKSHGQSEMVDSLGESILTDFLS